MKIFISFLIILILGGVVFYLGWINNQIPLGYIAVIHTSTSGFVEHPVKSDEFTWMWENILPTNMTIYKFSLTSYQSKIDSPVKGYLYPSGESYAQAIGLSEDFYFEMELSLVFKIRENNLVSLVINENLTPDTLNTYYQKKAEDMALAISKLALSDPLLFSGGDYEEKIKEQLSKDNNFVSLEILQVIPSNIKKIPDYDNYLYAKKSFFALKEEEMKTKLQLIQLERQRDEEALKKEIQIIQQIEDYGSLLENYPILIEFLQLRKLSSEEFLKFSEIKNQGE
ncbi:MAG: hypothetical protein JXR70_10005 [Spirochaetales bacterium]|nr:hypothetical protein [Spirochaetales bacterium]